MRSFTTRSYGLTAGLLGEGTSTVDRHLASRARRVFALLFTLVAIGAFYFAEWIERRVAVSRRWKVSRHSMFLRAFCSVVLVITALVAVFILPSEPGPETVAIGWGANFRAGSA